MSLLPNYGVLPSSYQTQKKPVFKPAFLLHENLTKSPHALYPNKKAGAYNSGSYETASMKKYTPNLSNIHCLTNQDL